MRRTGIPPLLVLTCILVPAALPVLGEVTESAESCGACHRTIYESWRGSSHANSLDNEIFLGAYRMTRSASKARAAVCLDCHAPLVLLNGDRELAYRHTWEGVTCDICHGLASVDLSGHGPRQVLEPGPVKRGPFGDAPDAPHGVEHSELLRSALACAWCHEYVNPEGVSVLTTYSEWRASSRAERGESCQACHMSETDAGVEDPRLERVVGAKINLHEVPGGHSIDQLNRALGLSIDPRREDDELVVELRLHNKGAGHAVPTGMPGRRVILELAVRSGDGRDFEERKVYGKFFLDAEGRRITRDGDYFAGGVRLESDSRIGADERRVETFRFPVPRDVHAYLTVKLNYEHSPTGGEEGRTYLTFLSERRTLAPDHAD